MSVKAVCKCKKAILASGVKKSIQNALSIVFSNFDFLELANFLDFSAFGRVLIILLVLLTSLFF